MRIGFVGPFGDTNFGDYAMLINNIYDIDVKDIYIYTYDYLNTNTICSYYLEDYNWEIKQIKSNIKRDVVTSNKYSVEYDEYLYTPMEIIKTVENAEEIAMSLKLIDKLVVIGGGYLNRLWNSKHRQYKLFSIMCTILLANMQNKKMVFLGNTYGPYYDIEDMFCGFFSSLKSVVYGARDNIMSPIWFGRLGINKELELIPDDIYFINDKLKKSVLTNVDIVSEEYIILEVYYSMDDIKKNIDFFRRFVKEIKLRYGYNVVFLPFDQKYGGEFQGQFLKENIEDLILVNFDGENYMSICNIINLVKNAKFVICNRYHLFVFALANNIPVIQILKDVLGNKNYYYCKSKGMLNQVFANQMVNECDFFELSVTETFEKVKDNLLSIIQLQKSYYSDDKRMQEEVLYNERIEFINKYIKNGTS